MYADALLSRQLQDEEFNSLEQRVDALIKNENLMNHSKKSTFNSHCIQILHNHEQSILIGPRAMIVTKLEGKSIEDTVKKPLINITMQSRYPSITVVTVTHLLAIMVVASVESQRYLVFIVVLLVEQMDTYLGSVHKCNH